MSNQDKENYEGDASRGMLKKTPNTLGGAWAENRGRRHADESWSARDDNPFENDGLYNWNRRQGWDGYYEGRRSNAQRSHGGSLIGHDLGHAGKGPRGYRRADQSIFEDVCETLTLNPYVDASDIEVEVVEGHVYLNGTVTSREVKRQAELAVESISGVWDVQNFLKIAQDKSNESRQ